MARELPPYHIEIFRKEKGEDLRQRLDEAIRNAENYIKIVNSKEELLPYLDHLKKARERGLKLEIIAEESIEGLPVYKAPGRPRYPFTILDGTHIFLEEEHKPNVSKRTAYLINDGVIYQFENLFDKWKEECNLIS